jgi:hypothetical protein
MNVFRCVNDQVSMNIMWGAVVADRGVYLFVHTLGRVTQGREPVCNHHNRRRIYFVGGFNPGTAETSIW